MSEDCANSAFGSFDFETVDDFLDFQPFGLRMDCPFDEMVLAYLVLGGAVCGAVRQPLDLVWSRTWARLESASKELRSRVVQIAISLASAYKDRLVEFDSRAVQSECNSRSSFTGACGSDAVLVRWIVLRVRLTLLLAAIDELQARLSPSLDADDLVSREACVLCRIQFDNQFKERCSQYSFSLLVPTNLFHSLGRAFHATNEGSPNRHVPWFASVSPMSLDKIYAEFAQAFGEILGSSQPILEKDSQ